MKTSFVALAVLLASGAVRAQGASWTAIRDLQSPAELKVSTTSEASATKYFLRADATTLFVFNFTSSKLTDEARRELLAAAPIAAGMILEPVPGRSVDSGRLHISADGVVLDGRKLIDVWELVTMIPRDDVVEILKVEKDGPPQVIYRVPSTTGGRLASVLRRAALA